MLITSLNDEKRPVFIENLASANPNFGEELNSRSVLINVIDLIIASLIKHFKINQKYIPRLLLNSFC